VPGAGIGPRWIGRARGVASLPLGANATWPWEVPELFCGFPARRPQATASVPARSDSVPAFGQVIGVSLDTGIEPGSDENGTAAAGALTAVFAPQRENAIVLDHGCPP